MLRLDVVAGRAMLQLIPRHKWKIVDLQVRSVSLTFRRTLYSTFNNLVVLLEITVVDRTRWRLEGSHRQFHSTRKVIERNKQPLGNDVLKDCKMPRFSDEWVVDRVLFDYVSGGSCACCGLSHSLFLPNGTNDLITSMTDMETDQMNSEIDILNNNHHPWPKPLRDQIWSDRVKLKQKLKSSIQVYTQFWSQHGTAFTEWLLFVPSSSPSFTSQDINNNNSGKNAENSTVASTQSEKRQRLQRCLQMSRDEFITFIQQKYQIHSAYMVVLTAVMEQVAHFSETKYPFDSLRSSENDQSAELRFEQALQFDRRSGFTLPILPATSTTEPIASIDVAQMLLDRIRTLGDAKLLGRGPSSTTTTTPLNYDDADDDDDDRKEEVNDEVDDDVDGPTNRPLPTVEPLGTATANASLSSSSTKCGIPTPSFQSDRRMIRLILARYWADILMQRYNTHEQNGEN